MKTSFRTIKISIFAILMTCSFAWAQESYAPSSTPNFPERPTKRAGESDAAYMNRTRQWEAEIRRLTAETTPATTSTSRRRTDDTTNLPEKPEKREGESEASYQNRVSAWAAEVKLITTKQQKEDELDKLRQELAKLSEQITRPARTESYSSITTERISVIPTGEMGREKLLSINEDLKIMSKILQNELNQQPQKTEWIFKDSKWVPTNPDTGTILGLNANSLNSMYLEGYGALFEMNVNYPLSIPYEALAGESQNKENDYSVWERTKQQILEPQSSSDMYYRPVKETPEIIYDSQDVENIKTSLIKTLKYASNIRALQPDESVILKIIGAEQSIRVITMRLIEEKKYSLTYESNGTQITTVLSGNINDKIKSLSAPTILIIRAKKSDIDAFEKDELDFDKFREKVKVFSYPLISGN